MRRHRACTHPPLLSPTQVQEALRRADSEARAKAEKVAEVKRLTAAIAGARAELNKYEEQLEESRKYQEFLSALTPPEWFEEQERLRREEAAAAKELRRQAAAAERQAEADRRREEVAAQQPPLPKEELEAALEAIAAEAAELPEDWDAGAPPPPDDEPMYFTKPKQLLDVFAALEEQNLFLIQSSQETEEQLEELRQTYRETKRRMDAETAGLHAQVAALESAISVRAAGNDWAGGHASFALLCLLRCDARCPLRAVHGFPASRRRPRGRRRRCARR